MHPGSHTMLSALKSPQLTEVHSWYKLEIAPKPKDIPGTRLIRCALTDEGSMSFRFAARWVGPSRARGAQRHDAKVQQKPAPLSFPRNVVLRIKNRARSLRVIYVVKKKQVVFVMIKVLVDDMGKDLIWKLAPKPGKLTSFHLVSQISAVQWREMYFGGWTRRTENWEMTQILSSNAP